MLDFRLKAFRKWLTMDEPRWSDNSYPTFDYQGISYYSEPKIKEQKKSLDEVRFLKHLIWLMSASNVYSVTGLLMSL